MLLYTPFPTPAQRYPRLHQGNAQEWLRPLLRRLRWNLPRNEEQHGWCTCIAEGICYLLQRIPEVTEAEFLEVTDLADGFDWVWPHYLPRMAEFIQEMEAAGPLTPAIVQAVRRLDEFEEKQYEGGSPPKTFLWPLFRSQFGFSTDVPGWSTRPQRSRHARRGTPCDVAARFRR